MELQKIKKQYRNLAMLCTLLFIVAAFFVKTSFQLRQAQVQLEAKPLFRHYKTGKSTRYWIDLQFKDSLGHYEISGTEFKYLDRAAFTSEVKAGDTIQITYQDQNVYRLSKAGKQYLSFEGARRHDFKTHIIIGILYAVLIAFCIWVLYLNKIPEITINGKIRAIHPDYLFCGIFAVLFLILHLTIGLDYFFNKPSMR